MTKQEVLHSLRIIYDNLEEVFDVDLQDIIRDEEVVYELVSIKDLILDNI